MRKPKESKYKQYFEEIERLYIEEHLSQRQIGEKLGIGKEAVHHIFRYYLTYINTNRTLGDYADAYRKLKLNISYSETIDSEVKAHFLGFLYADGYCNDAGMFLTLHNQDIHILKTFAKYLDSDETIIKPIKEKYSRLSVTNKQTAIDLHKHGVVQAKTKILTPPNISEKLICHFIRGYFDGDGSIWFDKNANSYRVQFIGTEAMVEFFQKFFGTKLKIRPANKDKSVYRYGFSGNKQVGELLDKLYLNASSDLFLHRKYEKYIQCKQLCKK